MVASIIGEAWFTKSEPYLLISLHKICSFNNNQVDCKSRELFRFNKIDFGKYSS